MPYPNYLESEGVVSVPFTPFGNETQGFSGTVSFASGTATIGVDFTGTTQTLFFPAGDPSDRFVFFTIINDNIFEGNETVRLTDTDPSGTELSTVTIVDDDPMPTITITPTTAAEGAPLAFAISLSNPSAFPITLNFSVADTDGDGVADSDATGQLVIPPLAISAVFSIPTLNDDLNEADEEFVFAFTTTDQATVGTPSVTGTITDNDVSTLRVAQVSGRTEGSDLSFEVSLDKPLDEDVVVLWSVGVGPNNGNAEVADFPLTEFSGRHEVTIKAGNQTATFTISTIDDALWEGLNPEQFRVTVTVSPSSRVVVEQLETATIVDNEARPTVSIADAPSRPEGGFLSSNALIFPITATVAAEQSISVSYAITGGTAGSFDLGSFSGVATIPAGERNGQIVIPISGDGAAEDDEEVVVTITDFGSALPGRASASGTIIDDDRVNVPTGITRIGDDDRDVFVGTRQNDVLRGRGDNDILNGRAGNDLLDGGRGNDRIISGPGRDTIIFQEGDGQDRILDFRRGFDTINLDLFIGDNRIDDFAELQAFVASGDIGVTRRGNSVEVRFDDGDQLRIDGINNLRAQDWSFNPVPDDPTPSIAGLFL